MEENNKTEVKSSAKQFLGNISAFMRDFLDINNGLDRAGTVKSIIDNKRMVGSNVWLLICAIMVASIGLDTNSPAVIIGAMLISPLMSPILGIGLGVAINDRVVLMTAIRHFGLAIIVSLVTSVVYFWITPFGDLTSEMAARTRPHLLDVLVAFFGGIAGIVAGSRLDKTNAIPGVAIATALLPPLCVSGYGLATLNMPIFLNSFYLFFLNSVFVALATYLVVRFLNFPYKRHVNPKERLKTNLIITALIAIVVLPSIIFLSRVIKEIQTQRKIERFVNSEFIQPGFDVFDWDDLDQDSLHQVNVYIMGAPISNDSILMYQEKLATNIPHARLHIQQMNIDVDEDKMTRDIRQKLMEDFKTDKKILDDKDQKIIALQTQLDSIQQDTIPYFKTEKQLKILFPQISDLSLGKTRIMVNDSTSADVPTALIQWSRNHSIRSRKTDEQKIKDYLMMSLELDTVRIVRY